MDPLTARSWKIAAWKLARRQHWVIAHRQLLALGAGADAIKHRVASRRLHRLFRGVYSVGRPDPGRLGWLMAATLTAGPEAYISHISAAGLWSIARSPSVPIHASLSGTGGPRRRAGLLIHHRVDGLLAPGLVSRHHRIPVTAPGPTIIDVAPHLSLDEIDAMVSEADKLDLIDPDALRALAAASPNRPGAAKLSRALDRHTFVLSDSRLERLFVPLALRAGLEKPVTRSYRNSHRVDFLFDGVGLVVETDGLRYHRTPGQQTRDLRRDQDHAMAGQERLRFSHWQVKHEPGHVVEVLTAVGARLRAPGPRPA
jgi:hypothetical protein